MLKNEKKYEFRKRLLNIHKRNIRNFDIFPQENELELKNGINIVIPENCSDVILTGAKDFTDYLFKSMKVSAMITNTAFSENAVICSIDETQSEDYIIKISDKVYVSGKNDRGVTQGLYCLEDKMNIKKAPILKKEEIKHTYLFSPRMAHSGYGLDMFPDEYLASVAHAGMDAIMLFIHGVNLTHTGFVDFNDLIYRASRYGIDVYAYSCMEGEKHPDEEDAQEFFDNLYGTIFRECPGLKGLILVGEAVGFPSKDPNVVPNWAKVDKDGFPTGKPAAGWWPCCDYPQWLECVKKSVRDQKADADIIFWTYNWGYVDKENRLKLINSLPTDITLMATYEMFESFKVDDISEFTADYSLAFAGPGEYFKSEAEVAKKRGIRMYAMSNTGGRTWDMGVIPYEPMPYQWIKRYKGLREAAEKWGLSGLMECHHYGFHPSFIGDLAKQCFIKENTDSDKCLHDVLAARFGAENTEKMCVALEKWSEAITHFTPGDADQYGAFRIGPAYPLCLIREMKPKGEKYAECGSGIVFTMYPADYHPTNGLPTGRGMLPSLRVDTEIKSLTRMYELIREGTDILSEIKNKNEELLFLINMGEYMCCYVTTGINAKRWYKLSSKIKSADKADEVIRLADEMTKVILDEKENAERAIEFVRKDSCLGWEPCMEYMGDESRIRWKIKHLEYVLDFELACYKKGIK